MVKKSMIGRSSVRTMWSVAVVLLIVIFFALPLFGKGFIPTHDGEYHIIRFAEFFSMLRAGYWFPRWSPTINSGYGLPLFNFHYPFPNYMGAFFHMLGWSFVDGFKLSLASGYIVACFCCFIWLKKLFGNVAAIVGTIVFSAVPYWFVDIYVRGSVGEVFALMWIMMALGCIEYGWTYLFALAVAGSIVSHNILAMIFLPLLVWYTVVRRPSYLTVIALGVGLSGYFWIPALLERSWMVGLNTVNFRDHFPQVAQLLIPSWGTGFSGPGFGLEEMSQQIGVVPLLVIVTSFIVGLKEKSSSLRHMLILFFSFFLLAVLLMLPFSIPIWNFFVPLQYIQYPWRLLSLILPVTAFYIGYISWKLKTRWVIFFAIFAVLLSYTYSRPVVYSPRTDEYYLTKPEFTEGTSSIGNSFTTIWSPWKQVRPKARMEIVRGAAILDTIQAQPLLYAVDIDATAEAQIQTNVLYYPGWNVMVDRRQQPIDYTTNGTVRFSVSPGHHRASVFFTETLLRTAADVVSLISLFCLGVLAILSHKAYAYRH